MRWWWVRHAPTHARAAVGWTDVPADLSDAATLDRLAAALPHGPVVIAPLPRPRAPAWGGGGPRPRLPDEPAFRELHFGEWEGLGFDAIAARDPEASARFFDRPGPTAAPGGESFDQLAARVAAAVGRLNDQRPADDLIVVAHAGAIQAALAQAARLTAPQALAFAVAPLSLTRLDWLPDAAAWRVSGVNLTVG
jgi:broad specificity phosphatase PhoE